MRENTDQKKLRIWTLFTQWYCKSTSRESPFWFCFFSLFFYYTVNLPIMSASYMQKSSVIRQKGQSQNGCFKKTKHVEFSEKRTFFYPLIRTGTCAYQGVKTVRFSENLTCFVFLKYPFWGSPFCLITVKMLVMSMIKKNTRNTWKRR